MKGTKKNIALLISSLNNGGAERAMSRMANYWSGKGNDVHLILLSNSPPFYKIGPEVKTYVFDLSFDNETPKIIKIKRTAIAIGGIKKILKSIKPDILISFGTSTNLYAILMAKLTKTPVIIGERTNPEKFVESFSIRKMRALFYRKADTIVLQTEVTRTIYSRLKIKLPRSVVIENPIDSSFVIENKKSENSILSIGRLTSEKGHQKLIKAISKVNLQDWTVKIVGGGPLEGTLQNQIKKLHLTDKIFLEGRKKDVTPYLSKASIFVLTSSFEGFPNVLCEAMIAGCACISFDCETGPSELIDSNHNGILVEKGNIGELALRIQELIDNEEKRIQLSNKGKLLYNRLSMQRIMDKWDGLIDQIKPKK